MFNYLGVIRSISFLVVRVRVRALDAVILLLCVLIGMGICELSSDI